MNIGPIKGFSLNGVRFTSPKDCTPNLVDGGRQFTEFETYGDGTTAPKQNIIAGQITGMKARVFDAEYDSFKSFLNKEKITIVVEGAKKDYSMQGFVTFSDGFTHDITTGLTNDFSLISQDGLIRIS